MTTATDPKHTSFYDVITSRRSVRFFTETPVPDDVLNACLDMAMLAPSSSNLQPWQFYIIDTPAKRTKANSYCLNQNAARTANRLIAIVACSDNWQQHAKDNIRYYPIQPPPKTVKDYYNKLIPLSFMRGPANLFSPAKRALASATRQVKGAMMELMYNENDVKMWALMNTMLAAENLMLALCSYGFDSCPIGGFDEVKMKHLLNLDNNHHIALMLAIGKRAEKGIYSPQYRFERERFIKKI